MQSEILKAHPQGRLRVYAIWVSKVFGDARHRWDAAGLTDPRVVHLWDEPNVSGEWLAANVQGHQGGDWDTYLLFGPDATWTSQPTPLRSSGSSVAAEIEQLSRAISPLLTASAAPRATTSRSLRPFLSLQDIAAVTLACDLRPGVCKALSRSWSATTWSSDANGRQRFEAAN